MAPSYAAAGRLSMTGRPVFYYAEEDRPVDRKIRASETRSVIVGDRMYLPQCRRTEERRRSARGPVGSRTHGQRAVIQLWRVIEELHLPVHVPELILQ